MTLDPEYERKVLRDVQKQLENPEETARQQAKLRKLIHGIGSAGIFIAFLMAFGGYGHPILMVFIGAFSGSLVGWGLFVGFAARQWPVTQTHIDADSIRTRLNEL